MKNMIKGAALAGLLSALAAVPSYASVTFAGVWVGDVSNNASIIPAGPPTSTFSPGPLNYDSLIGGYTIGGFVNDPTGIGFSNPVIATNNLNNTHWQFQGTLGLLAGNNSFVVGHDDGLILNVTGFGLVVNTPGPTAFVNTPFNVFNPGAAGNFAFQLDFNECCGPPSALLFTINNVPVTGGVPEPATWAMLILGFAGIGTTLYARTRRQSAIA